MSEFDEEVSPFGFPIVAVGFVYSDGALSLDHAYVCDGRWDVVSLLTAGEEEEILDSVKEALIE